MTDLRIDEVRREAVPVKYEAAAQLRVDGGSGHSYLGIVDSGRLRLFRISSDGRELTLRYLQPGELLGRFDEGALIEAVEPSEILWLSADKTERLMNTSRRFSAALLQAISELVSDFEELAEELTLKDADQRVAAMLLRLCRSEGTPCDGNGCSLKLRLTHREMASLVGTSRETLTRCLSHLRQRGVIELNRRRLRIRDKESLERLAA